MKRIILALLIVSSFLVSCDQNLDLKPFNALETEVALQTPSDFTNAVRGVYSSMRGGSYYGGWYISTPDILADNLIISSEGRTSKQSIHYWNYSGNNTWGLLWDQAYRTIYRANAILENLENLDEGDFRNNIEGEALALRALSHFDMARVYAKFPQDGASDMGIPYVTSTDVTLVPERPTVQETYDNILADFQRAKDLIADNNGDGRLGADAVNGLLSRVYLYIQDYDGTINAASAALRSDPSVGSIDLFPGIWTDATDEGVAFKIRHTEADGTSIGVEYSQTGTTGVRSEYVAAYDFFQLYQENDIRTTTYFSTTPFADKLFNHIAKYFGRETGSLNVVDTKVLRWAEVYLNRAEAYAEKGMDAEALADLDVVRSQRYTDFTSGNETGQALKDAIQLERRLELAFEGHRFFDLKRQGLPVDRSNFGDLADGTGVTLPADALLLPADDPRFQLPIPQAELNANPNMQQNPGY
ncbi:RagB/SusD family nutrient uptake outer membrane protein [Flavilitoribacter nigricans]|uniref:RagB/SusD family nutrient uptake outer membrane protein n=1 Tax=Flavilitoribacter nigricans (strain ATCC 23147 / DSM 23189 / NBRC 102662 / NCIMB 1420 / SS-2) TaxID=1122177 RepID=A0A2D0N4R6_FLAN2|nr:RagB/SusD family nutrient uptake outer membrane protein [Flavilitoribacter nigricans]PHN03388.1 RagB/SusD family nutrient uptake outer membrane protein [Flavilitoribacter nigricans DSM 23189 = NBRC 102662]